MTHKEIAVEFVVPTVFAIALGMVLGIVLSIGAVYVMDHYFDPVDRPQAHRSVAPTDL